MPSMPFRHSDEFFNVTPAEMRGVSLGNARAFAGGEVSIPLLAPNSSSEKRINISYDAAKLKAHGHFRGVQSLLAGGREAGKDRRSSAGRLRGSKSHLCGQQEKPGE